MQALSFAWLNIRAAAQALAAVMKTRIAETIVPLVDNAKTILAAVMGKPDAAAAPGLQDAVDAVGLAAQSVSSTAGPEAPQVLQEAAASARAAFETLNTTGESRAKDDLLAALEKAAGGAQAISQAEDQAVIAALRSSLAAIEPVAGLPGEETPLPPAAEAGPGKPLSTRLGSSERLDQIAFRYYGNAAYWRLLALFNDISDPLHIIPGRLLQVPSVPARGG